MIQKRNELNEKINDLILFDEGVKKLVPWLNDSQFQSLRVFDQVERIWGVSLENNFVLICLYENSEVFYISISF